MAKTNPDRAVQHERRLAERVREERERRGWTLEALAQRMTDAGCPLDKSAIYRIESGKPPRRITVDEAATFAGVFELDLRAMLLPPGVAKSKEAARLWRRYSALRRQEATLRQELQAVLVQLLAVVDDGYEHEVQRAAAELAIDLDDQQLGLLWRLLRDPDDEAND